MTNRAVNVHRGNGKALGMHIVNVHNERMSKRTLCGRKTKTSQYHYDARGFQDADTTEDAVCPWCYIRWLEGRCHD